MNKPKDHRVENTVQGLKEDYAWHLRYTLAKYDGTATPRDRYTAFAHVVRDRIVERWMETQERYHRQNERRVYYLSLEFLIGRLLGNNVINLKIDKECSEALKEYGLDWNRLRDFEVDAGLGNGGLGRLAACFLDSMSTLDLAGMGYGLRYDFGIFRQRIVNGQQVEEPDNWLKDGSPWECARPEYAQPVQFGGHVECLDEEGLKWKWVGDEVVEGVPYDMPVVGYNNAVKDFSNIKKAPVVLINTPPDGHHGTFYEMYGGAYSTAVRKWLDWQLKGKVGESALFMDTEYMNWKNPGWTVDRKNW